MRVGAGSLRRQLVVLSAATTAGAVILLVLLVQVLLNQTTKSAVSRVLDERIGAVISSAEVGADSERLVVPAARLDAGVAVYDGDGRLVAGAPPSSAATRYADLAAEGRSQSVTLDESSIIRSEPFTLVGGVDGLVIVIERIAPYEDAERYALVISIGTGLLAILASAALAAFVSRRALAPVLAMAETAEEWSERDLTSRFNLGAPGNELTALGHTLDSLLDKVASAIRSEQRLTAELAHELRTPLTSIQGTADLIAMRHDLDPEVREDVEELQAASRRMAETITVLLDLARSTSASATPTTCHLRAVLDDVVADLGEGRGVVRVTVPADVRLGLPHALAQRALGPVIDNAVRHGEVVEVGVLSSMVHGWVEVSVDDDGDGVAPHLREAIFEPGQSSGHGSGHSAGLGLPLARRIARSAGGDVRLDEDGAAALGGTRFVVELPSA